MLVRLFIGIPKPKHMSLISYPWSKTIYKGTTFIGIHSKATTALYINDIRDLYTRIQQLIQTIPTSEAPESLLPVVFPEILVGEEEPLPLVQG